MNKANEKLKPGWLIWLQRGICFRSDKGKYHYILGYAPRQMCFPLAVYDNKDKYIASIELNWQGIAKLIRKRVFEPCIYKLSFVR